MQNRVEHVIIAAFLEKDAITMKRIKVTSTCIPMELRSSTSKLQYCSHSMPREIVQRQSVMRITMVVSRKQITNPINADNLFFIVEDLGILK